MIPLISIDERKDLCVSTDLAVKEPKDGREPCRAIPKQECEINGETPLVFQVRALRSREMVRVMKAGAESIYDASIAACEIGLTKIEGEGIKAVGDREIMNAIDRIPYLALIAVGSYIIDQSTLTPDPKEASEQG